MTDPITDMLNRIRNGQAVNHPAVDVDFSNLKYKIAKILEKEGFIKGVEKKGRMKRRIIKITLKYTDKTPAISGMKRVSKPGQRVYLSSKKIKRVKGGLGIVIVSTSKDLMTNKEAKKQGLGGEALCEIW